jgi:hypothetical protein
MTQLDPDLREAAIQRALAPLARLFPAATIERMREQMREYATTHPYPVALLRQISPEPAVQGSHVRAEDGEGAEDAPAERLDGTGRGKR